MAEHGDTLYHQRINLQKHVYLKKIFFRENGKTQISENAEQTECITER